MVEGFSNVSKAAAARAIIGTDGIQVRLASGDPGANGVSSILAIGRGGYQHENIDNSAIVISAAGVIKFPNSPATYSTPTGDWSGAPTWAALFTRESNPRHIANVDITDIARPGTANTITLGADAFSLTPMP